MLSVPKALSFTTASFVLAFAGQWILTALTEEGTPDLGDTLWFAAAMSSVMAGMCVRMIVKKYRVR